MLNNSRVYQHVARDLRDSGLADCATYQTGTNAKYGAADLDNGLRRALVSNTTIHAAAESMQILPRAGDGGGAYRGEEGAVAALRLEETPGPEWLRRRAESVDPVKAARASKAHIEMHIGRCRETKAFGRKSRRINAVDGHDIERYDGRYKDREGRPRLRRKNEGDLVRGRAKNGTSQFERRVTACIAHGAPPLKVATTPVRAGDKLADCVLRVVDEANAAGAGAGMWVYDRGLWGGRTLDGMNSRGECFLAPCPNTPAVKRALKGFVDGGKKRRVVRMHMESSDTRADGAPIGRIGYTGIIEKRRHTKKEIKKWEKKGGMPPHVEYIMFATNMSLKDAKRYKWRWAIETIYKMIEMARVRTCSGSAHVREFCWLYSVAGYSSWVMANVLLAYYAKMRGYAPYKLPHRGYVVYLAWVLNSALLDRPPPISP